MEKAAHQASPQETSTWTWPLDDRTPVDITNYYVSTYSKKGLSYWIGTARLIGDTYEEWEKQRKVPIVYLLKVATDAIHERLYYVLARTLNLPQQHVFWAMNPLHDDLISVAIRFEQDAFFPRNIDSLAKTVTYRRKTYRVPNADDFLRHEVLHRYCGTGDIHQAMVKGEVLFGIDAADCMFHAPMLEDYWLRYLEHYRTNSPECFPIIHDMMQRIASHPELPDLVEQELLDAPGPIFEVPFRDIHLYSRDLREMHNCLVHTLEAL